MKATVIVCVYNRPDLTEQCLSTFYAHHDSSEAEVTVVDDGSAGDDNRDVVAGFPAVRYVRNSERRGYTKAANQGLWAASGDVVIWLNSDVVSLGKWVDKMVAAASRKRAGVVGPSLVWMGEDSFAGRGTPYIEGYCIGAKRSVIEEIGYKYESTPSYSEDRVLGYQCFLRGLDLVQVDVPIKHLIGQTHQTQQDVDINAELKLGMNAFSDLFSEEDPKKIFVRRRHALGDVVFTVGAICGGLRNKYPNSRIVMECGTNYAPYARGGPYIDEVVTEPDRATQYDIVVNAHPTIINGGRNFEDDIAKDVKGHEYYHFGQKPQWARGVEPGWRRRSKSDHHVMNLAEIVGVTPARMYCQAPDDGVAWAEEVMGKHSGPHIIFHPSGGWNSKRWPIKDAVRVGERLRDYGTVYWISQHGEEQIPDGFVDLRHKLTSEQLMGLIWKADLMVSSDSGPAHLAAGLWTPVVSIWGCTSPDHFMPWHDGKSLAVRSPIECSPCNSLECARGDLACMSQISADLVARQAERLLMREDVYGQYCLTTAG